MPRAKKQDGERKLLYNKDETSEVRRYRLPKQTLQDIDNLQHSLEVLTETKINNGLLVSYAIAVAAQRIATLLSEITLMDIDDPEMLLEKMGMIAASERRLIFGLAGRTPRGYRTGRE